MNEAQVIETFARIVMAQTRIVMARTRIVMARTVLIMAYVWKFLQVNIRFGECHILT